MQILDDAARRAVAYLNSLQNRPVSPRRDSIERLDILDTLAPQKPTASGEVLARLDEFVSPATMAMAGPRFCGFVSGGSLPVTLAANWLAAAWELSRWRFWESSIALFPDNDGNGACKPRERGAALITNHRPGARAVYRLFVISTIAGLTGLSLGCTMKEPLRSVSRVELPPYMGDWYVIANIPYFAERKCFDSVESYALRADGKIDNRFSCRKKSFDAPLERKANAIATVADKTTNAVWSIKFFGIISVKYFILDLDPTYQWVAVGHPSRRYGWIMARSKTLDDSTYRSILRSLSEQGYDPGKFEKVPQREHAPVTLQN